MKKSTTPNNLVKAGPFFKKQSEEKQSLQERVKPYMR